MSEDERPLRDYVYYKEDDDADPRLGVVIRHERCPGVIRGHVCLWFGETDQDNLPIIDMVRTTKCTKLADEDVPVGVMR